MKNRLRTGSLACIAISSVLLFSPASYAGPDTDIDVNSGPGASVEVEQHNGILPRNRGTDVHINTPGDDAVPTPPPEGGVVEEHSETTIHHD
jgi:hypothetical protein